MNVESRKQQMLKAYFLVVKHLTLKKHEYCMANIVSVWEKQRTIILLS